jgi:hypothetical protein
MNKMDALHTTQVDHTRRKNQLEMASLVGEIVEVTQCDPALAQAVLGNVTDDVSSPVSCALQFSRQF